VDMANLPYRDTGLRDGFRNGTGLFSPARSEEPARAALVPLADEPVHRRHRRWTDGLVHRRRGAADRGNARPPVGDQAVLRSAYVLPADDGHGAAASEADRGGALSHAGGAVADGCEPCALGI